MKMAEYNFFFLNLLSCFNQTLEYVKPNRGKIKEKGHRALKCSVEVEQSVFLVH